MLNTEEMFIVDTVTNMPSGSKITFNMEISDHMKDYLKICIKNKILRVDTDSIKNIENPNMRIDIILGNIIVENVGYIKC